MGKTKVFSFGFVLNNKYKMTPLGQLMVIYMDNICGFIVLRKPIENFDEQGRGAFLPYAPKLGETYYAGVDRMSWFELDEDFFTGVLPEQFIQLRKELTDINKDFTDFELVFDIDKAKTILEYSNQNNARNELIAIWSERLENTKGVIKSESVINWIGIDIYCSGYGSLIREGIFTKPNVFPLFITEINEHGLFNINSECIDEYINSYIKFAKIYNLESIDGATEYIDKIALGRVAT